jgi:lysophospholipase L1-like esterase
MRRSSWFAIATMVLVSAAATSTRARADFDVRDGDTVVFLGDSITAEGTYGRIIETYTLLRYPNRKAHFINAGWGGDTSAGGLARLERDVFARGATLVTVAYGINDIGWGGKADEAHRQAYLDGIRGIVAACKAKSVRVYVCSAAATGADPEKSADDFLQKMCDDGMKLSRDAGCGSIDVLRAMRQIQIRIKQANAKEPDATKQETLHAADTIHLNQLGQTAMAFAILKGLGAPADVSSVEVDLTGEPKAAGAGCKIENLKRTDTGLEFDRLDEGLPLNFGLFGALRYRFIPIPEELNRYMLKVTALPPGKYDVLASDRAVGTFTHEQLAAGVNLSSATADPWTPGGPWEAQAWALNQLTEARFHLSMTSKQASDYLKHHPDAPTAAEQSADVNARLETLQRTIAKPATYHFVVRKAPDAPAK